MPKHPHRRLLACILAVTTILRFTLPAAEPSPSDSRALRHTPAVEIFEQYKDTVVFVTGPMQSGERPQPTEFFVPATKGPQETGIGTGFLIHDSGYIVANAHAVEKLIFPVVVLANGTRCPAELLALLHDYDLALLKIDTPLRLKAVRLARSGDLMVGEPVIVIANPHGLLHTCTTGVLSAVGRNVQLAPATGVTLQNLIQSDAAVNPGSSGGPWFNAAGEVMGFTTVMRKDAENIAFAIPVAALRRRLPGMLDVERRYGLVTGLELADEESPRVITVASDSPAAKAGVRVYDIITKVADQAIATSTDFCLALIGRKPGETLAVKLDRGGKSQEVSLVLASRPKPDGAVLLKKKLGLDAAPLEPAKAKAMGLRVARGMVVARVESSFYEKLAHAPKPGDVLARIGWIRPRDLEHVGMLLENVRPKQPLSLVFLRRDGDVGTRIDINYVVP